MSASNEKKTRKDAISETPKTAMEIEKQKAEKRSNFLYGLIAVVFVVLAVVSLVWKSGIVNRTATAVTIDGQKYSAAEVNFYYQNVYRRFSFTITARAHIPGSCRRWWTPISPRPAATALIPSATKPGH